MLLLKTLQGITKVLEFLNDKLPVFNVDIGKLNTAVAYLQPKLEIADKIFPVSEIIVVLGILLLYSTCMIAFWAIQRAINLIRGAG